MNSFDLNNVDLVKVTFNAELDSRQFDKFTDFLKWYEKDQSKKTRREMKLTMLK